MLFLSNSCVFIQQYWHLLFNAMSFFLVRTSFNKILRQSHRFSALYKTELRIFRNTNKLLKLLIDTIIDIDLLSLSLSNWILLEPIPNFFFTDIETSEKFLVENNQSRFKYLTRLINAYIHYQQCFNDENHFLI
jgi:hypothetical protein